MENSTELLNKVLLRVVSSLKKRTEIKEVNLHEYPPLKEVSLREWEQNNCTKLPSDIRNFYLTCNGMLLTWSVYNNKNDKCQPVGRMSINSIANLNKVSKIFSSKLTQTHTSASDENFFSDNSDNEDRSCKQKSSITSRNKLFELDDCNGIGKVCVLLKNNETLLNSETEIWFMDRSLKWFFITSSFCDYYRIMILSVGIPHWQYLFTEVGLPQHTKKWYKLMAPVRLSLLQQNLKLDEENLSKNKRGSFSSLNFSKVFQEVDPKPKTNEKRYKQKLNTGTNKNKPNFNHTKYQKNHIRTSQGSKPWM